MTNLQTRVLAASLVMIAGAVAVNAPERHIDSNVGVGVMLVAMGLFVVEYFRCTRK